MLFVFYTCINSHAVLVSPVPYFKDPSTSPLCGVPGGITPAMLSTPMATWRVGQEVFHDNVEHC